MKKRLAAPDGISLLWTGIVASAALVAALLLIPHGGAPTLEEPRTTESALAADPPPLIESPTAEVPSERIPIVIAQTPAPPAKPATTCIRVQSADQLAIADAEIFAAHGGVFAVAGFTDADGALRLPRDELACAELVVRHPEFETARLAVAAEPPSELVVTLRPGCALRGIVRIQDSGLPVQGVQVFATRKHRLPPCRDFASPGAANPRVDCAVSDARGRFEIRGLDPDAPWTLSAAGAGFIGAERTECRCGNGDVELAVLPLYGVRIVFTGAEGEPLPIDPDVTQNGGMSLECLDSSVIDMNSRTIESALIGAGGDCAGMHRENYVFLFATHDEREFVGRILFQSEWPGYEPIHRGLRAPRVVDGVSEVAIAVKPIDSGVGSLRVEFANTLGRSGGALQTSGAHDYVRLRRGDGRSLSLLLWNGPESKTFTGIPHGDYEAQFLTAGGIFRSPQGNGWIPVTISDVPAEVRFDVAHSGGLHVELLDSDGGPYGELATLCLRPAGTTAVFFMEFLEAPYEVDNLAPGEYEISGFLGTGFKNLDLRAQHARVTISAGEINRCVVSDAR